MREGGIIISFGCNDNRYKTQLKRLADSVNHTWGYGCWHRWSENYQKHVEVPYCFKTNILDMIRSEDNYRFLLWVDSSMYFIKPPTELFKRIEEQGYYVSESGYNCAQSVSDACLKLFGKTRDEAQTIKECSSGCVGIDLESEIGKNLLQLWRMYTEYGGTKGSRFHDNQSKDSRFLFHRQDQSVLSLCLNHLGLVPSKMGEYWDYKTDQDIANGRVINESVCLICRGL